MQHEVPGADVQRPLASVSATVDECSTVVFGPQDSHIQNTSTGLKGKSAKVRCMSLAEGILWKRRRAGGLLGKVTCMWKDGHVFAHQGKHGRGHRWESNRRVAPKKWTESGFKDKLRLWTKNMRKNWR